MVSEADASRKRLTRAIRIHLSRAKSRKKAITAQHWFFLSRFPKAPCRVTLQCPLGSFSKCLQISLTTWVTHSLGLHPVTRVHPGHAAGPLQTQPWALAALSPHLFCSKEGTELAWTNLYFWILKGDFHIIF